MTNIKHTPGPWTVKWLDVSHAMIYDASGMNVVPRMIAERGAPTEANARLIAAAPDLLSEIERLRAALARETELRTRYEANAP